MFTETIQYLKDQGLTYPQVGLILGSGHGELAEDVENAIRIPYENIPNFPVSTVAGHAGQLVYGDLAGKKVLILQGRFHYYEGYDLNTVTYPVRIFKELGVETVIITDHLNLAGNNPLIGANLDAHGPRFVDLTETYSLRGQAILRQAAAKEGIHLQQGVYTWVTGPSYETPAEIRYMRTIGGDAVGMSTVPEAIVAKHCGMEVLGISCITNLASGMQSSLNHEEVMEISAKVKPRFKNLIKNTLALL